MPREPVSLFIPDLSEFAKRLRADILARTEPPGHLAFLGLIAKAAGYQNHQDLRARGSSPPPVQSRDLDRALRVFDTKGRMKHWPSATKIQGLCLWAFWARFPPRVTLTEPEVNAILKDGNLFGDHVLMRRSLIDHRLVTRSPDGRAYQRIEQKPPPDAHALIRSLGNLHPN